MADFTLWATACETALWPAGTFAQAYEANRRAAVETMIEADSVASCVREIVALRKTWIGTAAELLCLGVGYSGDRLPGAVGQKIRVRSPVACGGHRPLCARWALRLCSPVKGREEPE
jgi:hypothetical protein